MAGEPLGPTGSVGQGAACMTEIFVLLRALDYDDSKSLYMHLKDIPPFKVSLLHSYTSIAPNIVHSFRRITVEE